MASEEPPESPSSNSSFAIKETSETTTSSARFLRSISTKEPSFSGIRYSPPRLSSSSLFQFLHGSSPLPSPIHSAASAKLADHQASYRCLSSVLKKDGQILSIAAFNNIVYTGSEGNLIRAWKLPEFAECGQLRTKASTVVALQVSHDRVYAAYADCKIRVWSRTWDGALKHQRLATLPNTGSYVRSFIAGRDKMAKHLGPITSLAINISDDVLYSASLDKTVKAWRISDLKCIETIQAHHDPINAILAADDGILYTASDDATVRVWRQNFSRGDRPHSLVVTLPAKNSPVKTLCLSSDDAVLYGGCTDGYLHYWFKGWFSGQLQYGGALQGHTHAVMSLASVGDYVVSGSADSTSRVWSRQQDGQHSCVAVLVGHRGPVRCVAAFSGLSLPEEGDEGCIVCSGSLDGVIKVWSVTRKKNSGSQGSVEGGNDYFAL